jgi:hypothetical protein
MGNVNQADRRTPFSDESMIDQQSYLIMLPRKASNYFGKEWELNVGTNRK